MSERVDYFIDTNRRQCNVVISSEFRLVKIENDSDGTCIILDLATARQLADFIKADK